MGLEPNRKPWAGPHRFKFPVKPNVETQNKKVEVNFEPRRPGAAPNREPGAEVPMLQINVELNAGSQNDKLEKIFEFKTPIRSFTKR